MTLSIGNSGEHPGGGYPSAVFQRGRANIFEMLLPPQVIILSIVLLLVSPLTILTGENLLIPVLEATRSLLMPEGEAMRVALPPHFYFKLAVFLFLSFFGFFQILLRIRLAYYEAWAKAFPRPDPLHVDYQPDGQQSMLAVLNWNLYRAFVIWAPPLVIGTITVGTGFLELYLFNIFIGVTISLPVMVITFLFLILLLGLFTVIALFNSLWTMLTTLFGDVVAITEPDLPARTVYERCRRIAFSSPYVYLLYPIYLIFLLALVTETVLLVVAYDVQDLIQFQMDFPMVFGLEALTFMAYIGLNYLKFYTYHDTLVHYYRKLPGPFRDRFVPPPAAA